MERKKSLRGELEELKSIVRFNGIPWSRLTEEQRNEVIIKIEDGMIKPKIIIYGTPFDSLDSVRKNKFNKICREAIAETLEKAIEKKIEIIEKSLKEIKILSFNALNYIKDIE